MVGWGQRVKEGDAMSGYLGRDTVFWQMGQRESPALLETIRALENVDFQDDEGTSYLHIAALGHKLEAITLLLEKGADPNRPDKKGRLPILYALGRRNERNPAILRVFLEHGLDLERKKKDGLTIRETILSFGDERLNAVMDEFGGRRSSRG